METSPLSCWLGPSEPKRAPSHSSIFKAALIAALRAGHGRGANPAVTASSPPPQPLTPQHRSDQIMLVAELSGWADFGEFPPLRAPLSSKFPPLRSQMLTLIC